MLKLLPAPPAIISLRLILLLDSGGTSLLYGEL